MSVEVALIALGTVAVRAATTLCLGDHKIAVEVGGAAIDHLAGQLTKERDKRKFKRLMDNFAEAVVDRIEPILDTEFRSLPENERFASIDAVRDTFAKASLEDDDLFAADLDAGHLDRLIRRRASRQSTLLSADGTALYDLLLRECCGYIIEISRGLPAFSTNALTELLRRDREIQTKTSRLLPPPSVNKAKAIAAAGEYVLDLLAACNPRTIDEVIATIRALAETRLEEALPVIARFASDPRPRVFEEILRCMSRFEAREYGETVLAKSTLTRLVVHDERTLAAACHMTSLRQLELCHFDPEPAFVQDYCRLQPVSTLRLVQWPMRNLALIGTRFRLASLGLFHMELDDLSSLDFVESVVELRIENSSVSSFAGVERWRGSLQKVLVVGSSATTDAVADLRARMPHLNV